MDDNIFLFAIALIAGIASCICILNEIRRTNRMIRKCEDGTKWAEEKLSQHQPQPRKGRIMACKNCADYIPYKRWHGICGRDGTIVKAYAYYDCGQRKETMKHG